ncbi:hypothetical protein Tco_0072029 [Tanacetum coccineum]
MQLGKKIKALRSDRGGEYLSQEFKEYLGLGLRGYGNCDSAINSNRGSDDHMDTLPSENTSEIPVEPESLGPPPELIPVRRSERTTRAPNRLCLNMEVEDDVVGDLGEPANYKCAMLDLNKVYGKVQMIEEIELHEKLMKSGSIMYAVRCTRPDVAFAQNLVSRYQQNPGKLHWVAVKHILKYLRNTRDMCFNDTRSLSRVIVFVRHYGGAVDWKSKKQTTIAMSAAQAEYMAASEAAMEAVWIRKFVGDLGVMPSIKEPINMYCDNSAAIIFAKDSGIMKGARHFLRRYHFVRESSGGEFKI